MNSDIWRNVCERSDVFSSWITSRLSEITTPKTHRGQQPFSVEDYKPVHILVPCLAPEHSIALFQIHYIPPSAFPEDVRARKLETAETTITKIVQKLDHHAFSIKLFACCARENEGGTLQDLYDEWARIKTKLLKNEKDRTAIPQATFESSITLSLSSARLTEAAHFILIMLSFLPFGLEFDAIKSLVRLPHFESKVSTLLLQSGLVEKEAPREEENYPEGLKAIHMLAPIRDFICANFSLPGYPADLTKICCTYFNNDTCYQSASELPDLFFYTLTTSQLRLYQGILCHNPSWALYRQQAIMSLTLLRYERHNARKRSSNKIDTKDELLKEFSKLESDVSEARLETILTEQPVTEDVARYALSIGSAQLMTKLYARAECNLSKAKVWFSQFSNHQQEATCEWRIGMTLLNLKSYAEAERTFESFETIVSRISETEIQQRFIRLAALAQNLMIMMRAQEEWRQQNISGDVRSADEREVMAQALKRDFVVFNLLEEIQSEGEIDVDYSSDATYYQAMLQDAHPQGQQRRKPTILFFLLPPILAFSCFVFLYMF
ncbi:hypothetical protein BT69DRAFT_336472 [Atractiella rhizophila]|nr:hypothetical protein BT69DRAFT_336472 [Atractiella rhizophila]